MVLPDVNVLVYAHRQDADAHDRYRDWLQDIVNGESAFALSDIVLSGFLRIVTHPKVFRSPSALDDAMQFVNQLRESPIAVSLQPGENHWSIFQRLASHAGARGNLIPDAYLAALAIEHGCEWITTDRDFSRFEGLMWRHPLSR